MHFLLYGHKTHTKHINVTMFTKTIITMKELLSLFFVVLTTLNVSAQVIKTQDVSSPGTLATLASAYADSVTNLTLTGSIDARDFKTMRDNMPVLASVDLSGVNIVAYTGTEGTFGTSSTAYPENEIPVYAFGYKSSLVTMAMPLSTKSIGSYAFYLCRGLTSVIIPSSVASIGSYAFGICRELTSVTIPTSVTSIDSYAFYYTDKLTAITVESGNLNYLSLAGVLFNKDQTTLIQYPIGNTDSSYTIPSTVTSIDNGAFYYCSGLTSITIPSSVTSIADCSFCYCVKLTDITVESGNLNYSSLGGVLFNKDQTTIIQYPNDKTGSSYTIPSTVTSIGDFAIYNCNNLTSITIPSTVRSIGFYSFGYCFGLTSVTIPSSVTSIADNAFCYCSGLTSINMNSKPLTINSTTFSVVNKTTCTLNVPYSAKSLYAAADYWNSFVNIVESTTGFLLSANNINLVGGAASSKVGITANVAWKASSDQSWLTVSPGSGTGNNTLTLTAQANQTNTARTATVTVSASGLPWQTITVKQDEGPKTIAVTAGGLSTALTSLEINTLKGLILTGSIDARDFKTMRDNMPLLSSVDLSGVDIVAYTGTAGTYSTSSTAYPENEIPVYAFSNKSSLVSMIMPLSAKSIGSFAFGYCRGLTSVTISSSVASIGSYAFYYCSGLTSVTIPSSVTSIGNFAFESCSRLTGVTIPYSVTSIGSFAFASCGKLTDITVESENLNYSSLDGVLFDKDQVTLLQYPNGRTSSSYSIPSTVTSIGSYAFEFCSGLTSVTIPSSLTSIGNYAFAYFTGLTSVNIPTSVTSIGISAFTGCSGLTTITIPSSVTSIGSYAFYNCRGLTSIYASAANPVDLTASNPVFTNVNKTTCTLYVPTGSKPAYQAAVQWKNFTNIVEFTTDIPQLNAEEIKIYPNPVTDAFHITGIAENANLQIINLNGQVVMSKQVTDNELISAGTLVQGLYIVKLTSNGIVMERKLIKK